MKKLMTLCFVQNGPQVLLGFKKRGFGIGRWNGFGGKVHEDESIEEAAKREVFEECALSVREVRRCGVLTFEFEGSSDVLEVHVFRASNYHGRPVETDEMKPQWFAREEIPFSLMWPDDRYWFPLFLDGKCFQGYFLFKQTVLDKPTVRADTIVRYSVKEVPALVALT